MSTRDDWEDLVSDVNAPPPVPRDRMWARIDAARQERRGQAVVDDGDRRTIARPDFAGDRGGASRWWRLGGAVAAVLVFGIAIGRMTAPTTPGPELAGNTPPATTAATPTTPGRDRTAELYQLAAADLFGRADARLTDFRVRNCGASDMQDAPSWAAGMLLQTRLLLDTPVAQDPTLRPLLDELELVLAQIVGLSRENCDRDRAFINDGLKERATLDRLRLAAAEGARRPL